MKQPWTLPWTSGSPRPALPWPSGYDGRIWAVAAEPVHWFARDSWWDTRRTAAVGVGDLVDIEYWRVQVRLGLEIRAADLRAAIGSADHAVVLAGISDDGVIDMPLAG